MSLLFLTPSYYSCLFQEFYLKMKSCLTGLFKKCYLNNNNNNVNILKAFRKEHTCIVINNTVNKHNKTSHLLQNRTKDIQYYTITMNSILSKDSLKSNITTVNKKLLIQWQNNLPFLQSILVLHTR